MRRNVYAICVAILFFVPHAFGQYAVGGTSDGVTGTGSVEINVRPEILQMTIQVEGRSSDLPQAAEELKRRIEVAEKKLKDLDATPDSVTVAKPKISGASSPQQAQQMQAMMQQYGGGSRGKEMLEQTQSVSITQSITARWPLSGQDDIDRLIASEVLTKKIRAADVASSKDDQPVSAAQEELAVEMTAMMDEYSYGEETTKAGEPQFQYVARVSNERYEEALFAAFEQAKSKINTLANVSKIFVDDPRPVSSSIGSQNPEQYYGRSASSGPKELADSGDYELLANDPNEATCIVTVTAVGKHKPKQ